MLSGVNARMTIVAVTGGVGAGKSTVTQVLEELGAVVIDADVLARHAVERGSDGLNAIADAFGDDVLTPDGTLDRGALGDIVFQSDQARATLNDIVHPIVRQLYTQALEQAQREDPGRVLVYAVPLLAEARSVDEFDAIVVVDAPAPTRVQRLMDYRGLSQSEAESRVNAQANDDERLALADVVLDASGDIARTEQGARELYEELVALWPDRLGELSRHFPRHPS